MRVEELTLSNVYVFHGKYTLRLASNGKKFTLIMARNNAGKTSIIRALRYLLYGSDSEGSDAAAGGSKKVINLEALRRSSGEVVECYVEARLSHGEKKFTLKRVIRAQVPPRKQITEPILISEQVKLIRHDETRDIYVENPADIEMTVLSMLPKKLFDFYFFKGEELQQQLIENAKTSIGKELFGILFRQPCERTVATLSSSVKGFDKRFEKATEGQDQLEEVIAKRTDADRQLADAKTTVDQKRSDCEKAEQAFNTADEEYLRVAREANPQLGEQLGRAKSDLEKFLTREKGALADYQGELRKTLLEALPNSLAKAAWGSLHDLHKRKLLPPSVSEGLLSLVLREGQCICGRSLAQGEPSRTYVEEYQKRTVSEKVTDRLYSLYARLNPEGGSTIQAKRMEVLESLDRAVQRIADAREAVAKQEERVRTLEGSYDPTREAQVVEMKKKRDLASHLLNKKKMELAEVDKALERLNLVLREIERELSQMLPDTGERSTLQHCRELSNLFKAWAEEFQRGLKDHSRKLLTVETKRIYSSIVTDRSDATIDAETLLPEIRKEGTKGYAAGGGQRQVLLLAFLIAMDKLRKGLETHFYEQFRASTTNEQCFFMDSVFSPMDPDYRAAVAGYLPGDMPQLVFLVAPQHWDEEVAKKLLPRVDRLYVFQLHTTQVPEQDPRTITFGKTKTDLVKLYKKGWESVPYSEVREVKF